MSNLLVLPFLQTSWNKYIDNLTTKPIPTCLTSGKTYHISHMSGPLTLGVTVHDKPTSWVYGFGGIKRGILFGIKVNLP